VASVEGQTATPDAIIVVDDGSTPPIPDMPGARVIYQENAGHAAARNTGIANAESEWVAFLDDDDIWEANKLELQWRALERFPSADIVFTDWLIFRNETVLYTSALFECNGPVDSHLDDIRKAYRVVRTVVAEDYVYCSNEDFSRGLVSYAQFVLPSAMLVRRSLALTAGGFDPVMRRSEAWDFCLRLAGLGAQGLAVERPLVRYRLHPKNVSVDYIAAVRWTAYMVLKARLQKAAYPPGMQSFWEGHLPASIRNAAREAFGAARFHDVRALYGLLVEYRPTVAARFVLQLAGMLDTRAGRLLYNFARRTRKSVRRFFSRGT
jgi:glycosyltransferase involved in cell wall biosynthesis